MTTVNQTRGEILDQLKDLLTTSNDATEGYQEASESVKDTELKSLFLAQARQRGEFAMELQREIQALGGDADQGTSLISNLHRAWISIKSTFTTNEDKATVQECQRGDQSALETYGRVLAETDLAVSTRDLLLRQKDSIESAHTAMSRLAQIV
jgi:uncharacterized protein (TIGR02284 family)